MGLHYEPELVERQRAFFDRYLLDRGPGLDDQPPVRAEVREAYGQGTWVDAQQWPLEDVELRPLHLDAVDGSLSWTPPDRRGRRPTTGWEAALAPRRATFAITFDEPVRLVGHVRAVLHLSARAQDADVFLALVKLDAAGEQVGFAHYGQFEDGPVALGWLRASHRELDPELSTDHLPVLAHRRALPLVPGEPTRLDVEVWPSGTRFAAGETLLLVVQGTDVMRYPRAPDVRPAHRHGQRRPAHRAHRRGARLPPAGARAPGLSSPGRMSRSGPGVRRTACPSLRCSGSTRVLHSFLRASPTTTSWSWRGHGWPARHPRSGPRR